jgi:FG-GAP repeat
MSYSAGPRLTSSDRTQRNNRIARSVPVTAVMVIGIFALCASWAYAGAATSPGDVKALPGRPQESPGIPGTAAGSAGSRGVAVALPSSGPADLAAVGAPGADRGRGSVTIFVNNDGTWRKRSTLTGPTKWDAFGYAVALSGRTLVVGAYGTNRVYIYHQAGTRWHRQASFLGPPHSWYAADVAISGPTVVVGDSGGIDGSAYIYHRSGSVWSRQALIGDPSTNDGLFGLAVAISGRTALIGGGAGAYIFVRSRSSWVRQATLVNSGSTFGAAVAISGSTVVIGQPGAYGGIGRVYVYTSSGRTWRRTAKLKDPDPRVKLAAFGTAVTISGPRILIGAPSGYLNTPRCGAAFDFARAGSRWHYRARVINPGCKPGDEFGMAAALLGRTAFIGAPAKNHGAGAAYEITVP